MSDEIDIEEHDVLDNPTIRRIFPDLSIIKKEIIQYEEGLGTTLEGTAQDTTVRTIQETVPTVIQLTSKSAPSETLDIAQHKSTNCITDVHQRFKTFLDSLADDALENININSFGKIGVDEQLSNVNSLPSPRKVSGTLIPRNKNINAKCLRKNIFILGSKPNAGCPKRTSKLKKQVKIVLKNVSAYLNESRRFCRHCLILFPDIDAMVSHTNEIHSPKATDLKEFDESATEKNGQFGQKSSSSRFQCDICAVTLSSKSNLSRHIRRVHKIKKSNKSPNFIHITKSSLRRNSKNNDINITTKSKTVNKETAAAVERSSKFTNNYNCFHCPIIFENKSSLIEHLYNVIQPKKNVSNSSLNSMQASKSPEIESGSLIIDNDNINELKSIDCTECAVTLNSQSELDKHSRENHSNNNLIPVMNNDNIKNSLRSSNKQTDKKLKLISSNTNLNKADNKNIDITNQNNDDVNCDSDSNVITNQISDDDASKEVLDTQYSEDLTKKKTQVYRCYICSQFLRYYKVYAYHMRGHNVTSTSEDEKTYEFECQCKFCSKEYINIKMYNSHISKCHNEKLKTKIKLDDRAFESVIFKCAQCDVFFLSVKAAKCHSEHNEVYINWKCSECERLFKMNDKLLHIKQHSLSKNITAYSLCESALLERVLFKCFKCAVHFSEEEYCFHHTTCDCDIPDSAYCNTCDVLINRSDMDLHKRSHQDTGLQSFDFTFIESDIMVNKVKRPVGQKKEASPKFDLTFCHTCKCFLSDQSKTHKAHIEKRCDIINPRICTKCGLVFTSKGYLSHKALHDKVKKLNMQSFNFYDIISNEQIRPPIPTFPQCNICEVHFLNKPAMREHECSQQHYTVCAICKMRLTARAFKLHIYYHKYELTSCKSYEKPNPKLKLENVKPTSNTDNDSSHSAVNPNSKSAIENFLFICTVCDITFQLYDKVIEHCHEHYNYNKGIKTTDQKNMQYNSKSYDKSAVILKFDPFYIRFPNEVWIKHIFLNISSDSVKNVLEKSMYKMEARFKMEEIQSGSSDLVLYKCDACRSYIDPNGLYVHAKNPCIGSKKQPCSICELCFSPSEYRIAHEKVHLERPNINTTSYKIILFNKTEHRHFTSMMIQSRDKFVLYQCRNCECIVDKLQRGIHQCRNVDVTKCLHCGLLFTEQDLNSHVNKHKEFLYYNPENMTIIMFGKVGSREENKLNPSFNGTIYDLTFYKCINCAICLKSRNEISKHVCVAKSYKTQCPKCYLSFSNTQLKEHFQLHESHLELGYDDFHSNIITFDLSTLKPNVDNGFANDSAKNNKDSNINDKDENITQKIYKCQCGLHFLEDLNARKHYSNCNPRQKIAKQSCFKCNLLFTPGELFEHLLKHHGDKKIQYKYDIINVTEG